MSHLSDRQLRECTQEGRDVDDHEQMAAENDDRAQLAQVDLPLDRPFRAIFCQPAPYSEVRPDVRYRGRRSGETD